MNCCKHGVYGLKRELNVLSARVLKWSRGRIQNAMQRAMSDMSVAPVPRKASAVEGYCHLRANFRVQACVGEVLRDTLDCQLLMLHDFHWVS